MIYVKIRVGNRIINAPLTNENVYTTCCECQKEIKVNLVEVFKGNNDQGPELCHECLLKLFRKGKKAQ